MLDDKLIHNQDLPELEGDGLATLRDRLTPAA